MQPVSFCTGPNCFEAAIKTKRSASLCRTHTRELLAKATDLVVCQVVPSEGRRGEQAGVTDAMTNETVRSGPVTLDPLETNIAALVYGGIVKVAPSKAAEAVKAKP